MSYSSLKCILEEYYNIKIPTIKDIKKTSNRKIYNRLKFTFQIGGNKND